MLEDHFSKSTHKRKTWQFFGYSYLSFLLWNIATTWWVCLSTVGGGIAAIVLNSLLMTIPVMMFWFTKHITKVEKLGYVSLVIYWLTFEYIHLNWDGSWPWLTLGNVFASDTYLVQWYEYTGVLGGTLWVLIINILIYQILEEQGIPLANWIYTGGMLIMPLSVSLNYYYNKKDEGKEIKVVIVQPNIDPYNEKFPGTEQFMPFKDQLKRLTDLSESKVDNTTEWLLWPETSIPSGIIENEFAQDEFIVLIKEFLKKYPNVTLLAGADTYKIHGKNPESESSRRHPEYGYYDNYNTALNINSDSMSVYHKSKLVPGVEKMPFAAYLGFLESLAINMGGTMGSLGTQTERTVFKSLQKTGAAPVICYESIYGDFVKDYVKNGANFIAIITNDGWWGNTPGYKQHLVYARLRAIELRRSIARAANTGVSCFINQRGDMTELTPYWQQDARSATIKANDKLTFYAKNGDLIGRVALFLGFALIVSAIVKYVISPRKTK